MNMAKRPVQKIDFRPYGAAIKAARTGQKESRNKVGDEMYLSPRYRISVDQLLFGDTADGKSTARRQLDVLADELTDREIGIIIATVQAVLGAREKGE